MAQNPYMQHWNSCTLAAIDTETTSLDPTTGEIIEIAIVPIGSDLKRSTHFKTLNVYIKPEKDLEEYRKDPGLAVAMRSIEHACKYGIEASKAVDFIIDTWYEGYRERGLRHILPLAHNWPFDSMFLRSMMGNASFEYMFSPRFRDPLSISCFLNDIASIQAEPFPFPKNDLSYLITQMKIERSLRHDALEDCRMTMLIYERLVRTYLDAWCGPTKSYEVDNRGGPYCLPLLPESEVETFGTKGDKTYDSVKLPQQVVEVLRECEKLILNGGWDQALSKIQNVLRASNLDLEKEKE